MCACVCVNWRVAGSGDDQLSDELVSVLSHRHLLEFIIERCSDVAPRFLHRNSSFYGAHTAPPMGDRLVVAVGLMGSEDPADSAF